MASDRVELKWDLDVTQELERLVQQKDACDARSRALALSSTLPHAGHWLNVGPSPTLGLHLQDREFRLYVKYWLGMRMHEENIRCPVCQRIS